MLSRRTLAQGFLALLVLAPVACSSAHGDQDRTTLAPFELSDQEIRLARDLAEHDLILPEDAQSQRKMFYIKTDLLPDSQAGTDMRKVMVTHYRYEGDETIHTFVDLKAAEAYRIEKHQHFPTALAPEEAARAEQLARQDARLTDLFHTHGTGLRVIPVPFETTKGHPLFGHRNVVLVLQVGRDYLTAPRVTVDLTAEAVQVEMAPR